MLSQARTWGLFVALCHGVASRDSLRLAAVALWVSTGSDGQNVFSEAKSVLCISVVVCISAGQCWLAEAEISSCIPGNNVMRHCDLSYMVCLNLFECVVHYKKHA